MMQIDTQVATPLKPANVYPQQDRQCRNHHRHWGWRDVPLSIQTEIRHFQWLILKWFNLVQSHTILIPQYLWQHAITTQESLVIKPNQLGLFTAAMAAGKQAWDWCIVVILMLSEKACMSVLGRDTYRNKYLECLDVHLHPTKHPH